MKIPQLEAAEVEANDEMRQVLSKIDTCRRDDFCNKISPQSCKS